MTVSAEAGRYLRDVLRGLTWQKLLLSQVFALMIELVGLLVFFLPSPDPPASFVWSTLIIGETIAFSILIAILIGDQAVARGCRPFRTYALALLVASIIAAVSQFQIRGWLGVFTLSDRPGIDGAVRHTEMIYAFGDSLTYGGLLTLVLLDYRRRESLQRRVRQAELERARIEQQLAELRLAALRADVDSAEVLTTLEEVHELFLLDAPTADRRLDQVIADLRTRLMPT